MECVSLREVERLNDSLPIATKKFRATLEVPPTTAAPVVGTAHPPGHGHSALAVQQLVFPYSLQQHAGRRDQASQLLSYCIQHATLLYY
mmetsp:Transcript_11381/g.31407  ORF Transcript_11381/g.31407 Transcript_11381/m.31407 type:complete len:89 (-) Transcript_11381:32-298(-)